MDLLENMETTETVVPAQTDLPMDSATLKNLEDIRSDAEGNGIAPEVLAQLKELQRDEKDISREFIDKVRDGLEEVRGGVQDFWGPDREETADFDPEAFRENIESGAAEWHEQIEPYSCAIASQHFIISEYTDASVTEQDLIRTASEMGWYEELGTPMADVGDLLMAYGIDVTVRMAGDFNDLLEATANGDRVLVSVQNMAMTTEWADGYPAYSANHVVEVLGIDRSDPEDPRVIVNDPGIPNGRAMSMTRENFEDAWMTGGGYMCVAHRPDGN